MSASEQITQHINDLADWRGKLLARLRKLILAADPDMVEEWKWGTPVWSHKGNVVAVGAFQDHVKINFFRGASLPDPHGLFNAGLEAKAMRAIDLHRGDKINESALKELVRAAVTYNLSGDKKK
jgi:hypothetical protein